MKKLLEVKNLTVAFDLKGQEKNAVNDISFDIYEKDFIGLVGESGCGKSVCSQTILGIEHPNAIVKSGSVKLMDKQMLGLREREWKKYRGRGISMIFQEPMTALNPLMKVGAQIEEVLKIHFDFPKEKRRALVYKTMENCGLRDVEDLYNLYPHELSGGMRQRIMISMALIANPRVLIADEPTTALDATIQMQILSLFKDLEEIYSGGILFITHDLLLVSRICKRLIVMYAGRIVEEGPVDNIINNPKHPYTKGLLKAIPSYKKRGTALYNIPGRVPPLAQRSNEGCPFKDRCDHTLSMCEKEFPKRKEFDGVSVYCHLYEGKND